MPEGDTVWRTARMLRDALVGEVLVRAELRVPQLGGQDLAGFTVVDVIARGKHLLLRLSRVSGGTPTGPSGTDTASTPTDPSDTGDARRPTGRRHTGSAELTLHTHLRMDGAWRIIDADRRWPRRDGPAHQVRVVLATATRVALGYRVHDVGLAPTAREGQWVDHLGPDVLGADWDVRRATANLHARPERPIGVALLDQRNLAGPGNIYRTEALFLHGVSPFTPVREVADLDRLVTRTRELMLANLDDPSQQTTGDRRPGREHWVHGRRGRPCRRCGTPVREVVVGEPGPQPGGRERATAWCPHCQPGPQPDDATYRRMRAAQPPVPDKLRKGPRPSQA